MMMTVRECYMSVLRFRKADCIPNIDFGPINAQLMEEWRVQGLPEGVSFGQFFELDRVEDHRYVDFGPIPGVPDGGVVAEDEETLTRRDQWGRVVCSPRKEAGKADGARRILREGVRDRSDWERIRDHFRADEPKRYPDHWDEDNWEEKKARWRVRDYPLWQRGPSMIGRIKEVMGFENFCLTLYDDPGLIEEMVETRTRLAEQILPRAFREVDIDLLHFWEDIAYNAGPILSPDAFERIAVPRYRRLSDLFRSYGGDIVSVDSDGDIRPLIPGWLRGGVNHFWPMEVNAGVDVVALRAEYGQDFSMRGGINKYALREGREAIDRELDRVAPVVADGGYIPSIDHGVPNGVTFENICYYMEKKRELLRA